MADSTLIAVRATKKDYYTLVHQPSQTTLDENGEGLWPADQFTFRLLLDEALKRLGPDQLKSESLQEAAEEADVQDPPAKTAKKG
jgi:hypothetical protein